MSQSQKLTTDIKQQAIAELLAKTTHDGDYYVLLVGSSLIAIGAIFTDSIAVLIASMIIAPLASPILALGKATADTGSKISEAQPLAKLSPRQMSTVIQIEALYNE